MREAGTVAGWVPGFVSTGLIRASLDDSISRTSNHLTAAGEEMYRLARVCEARAIVCADYGRAVWRYRQLTFAEQLAQEYPSRPASWAEL